MGLFPGTIISEITVTYHKRKTILRGIAISNLKHRNEKSRTRRLASFLLIHCV